VNGSGTIRVVKRDGNVEVFDAGKLAGAMYRAMSGFWGRYEDARELARAVGIYLARRGHRRVSSAAIFEMALKSLRRVRFDVAAAMFETHRAWRRRCRGGLRVIHADGHVTLWDKAWAANLAYRNWGLRPVTGRIIAGKVEEELLCGSRQLVLRSEVVGRVNAWVSRYGLADAVPITPAPAAI